MELPTLAADLLDRAITVRLNRLNDDLALDDEKLWQRSDKTAPQILGSLLDGLVASAHTVHDIPDLPGVRMTSFAKRGEAFCRALGYADGEFHRALVANLHTQSKGRLHDSVLGSALLTLMDEESRWHETMSELLAVLSTCVDPAEKKAAGWPSTPSSLGRELRKLLPLLSHADVYVEFEKSTDHHRTRTATLKRIGRLSVRPVHARQFSVLHGQDGDSGGQTGLSEPVHASVRNASDAWRSDADGSCLSDDFASLGQSCSPETVRTGRTDSSKCARKGVLR